MQTGVARTVAEAVDEIRGLRQELDRTLATLGLRAAVSGTHPFAIWQEIAVSGGERYQFVYGSMRELARREPTFALHVHVGVPDPETAIRVNDRMRVHLPLLLALSANSPFWQGRDSGLASARTPLFQAFPRVGVPRAFGDYETYVETVDLLIRTQAVPESTFLWWDVRPQPALGTVEIRVMDAQTRCADTAALVALVASLVKMEAEEGFVTEGAIAAQEVISENRFLAARDGVDAKLIDPDLETRIPVPDLLDDLLEACRPHAQDLGCADELESLTDLVEDPPNKRQISDREGRPLPRPPGRAPQRPLRRVGTAPDGFAGDVRDRLVVAARLAAQARARRQAGRDVHARHHRQASAARACCLRRGDRDLRRALRLGLRERPDRLVAVRRRDRHPDPRARAVGVALVVERDRDRDEAVRRHRRDVALAQAEDRLERRALARGRACARSPHPAALDEGLLAVGPDLGDRRLQVDARLRRADPDPDGAGAEHGRVLGERLGQVGDGGAARGAAAQW